MKYNLPKIGELCCVNREARFKHVFVTNYHTHENVLLINNNIGTFLAVNEYYDAAGVHHKDDIHSIILVGPTLYIVLNNFIHPL
jgi:hypothetical protein